MEPQTPPSEQTVTRRKQRRFGRGVPHLPLSSKEKSLVI
jgi:hypothetical protein